MKPSAQVMFDNLLMAFDDDIRVSTAESLAKDLGIDFVPDDYDH